MSSTTTAPRQWTRPRPNAALMHTLGVVNRWFFLRGYFKVRRLDIPAEDLARLEASVNRDTVAFIGPNHPEFGTDWMVDKEISTLVAPLMASWADRGIVAAAPRFWGMNNLIANDGGDDARAYSVDYALDGRGVLLHPEGSVRWTNDVVNPLFPGIAQMAVAAAKRTSKPVYIVPIVWKYRYFGDVSTRADGEMQFIEQALELESEASAHTADRFAALQRNLLAARMRTFSYGDDPSGDFFARQGAFQEWIVNQLQSRHSVEHTDQPERRIARLSRVVRDKRAATPREDRSVRDALKRDLELTEEAKRLGEFTRDVYGGATLTQEQIFESLKRTRDRLIRRDWKDSLAVMLPRPFGARVAHVGVPESIRVTAESTETQLLELARSRMQLAIDEINTRIEPMVRKFRVPNHLATL